MSVLLVLLLSPFLFLLLAGGVILSVARASRAWCRPASPPTWVEPRPSGWVSAASAPSGRALAPRPKFTALSTALALGAASGAGDDFSTAEAVFGDDTINPATGLPMVGGIGGIDVGGHLYGQSDDLFGDRFDSSGSAFNDSFGSAFNDSFGSGFDD